MQQNDELLDQMIVEELAKYFLEASKEHIQIHEDPFENYAYQLKMRLKSDDKAFKHRFVQGYKVLMETLERRSNGNPTS